MTENVDNNNNKNIQQETLFDGDNAVYLEMLFESYLQDPNTVSEGWRRYFSDLPVPADFTNGASHSEMREQFSRKKLHTLHASSATSANYGEIETERQQVHVLQLINNYRALGHLVAYTNPLRGDEVLANLPELTLQNFGLDKVDKNTVFDPGTFQMKEKPTLDNIFRALRHTYTESIGIEYMHILDTEEKRWIQSRIEPCEARPDFNNDKKCELLDDLVASETLERYLHKKYVGQKRFSLEGGESLIPMLNEIIHHSAKQNTREIVLAMAHRGRLNVLINVMGKSPEELFSEFEGKKVEALSAGDVKYHQGFSCDIETSHDPMHLTLAFNPSHLEIVSPVACGSVRARQERRSEREDDHNGKVIAVCIHGDAAFAGQGVVMESFNMSQTRGYTIDGTIHIVVNNQIGFTTSQQFDSRSTYYATDVAKMVNAPILHVNGDDPEAVAYAAQVALDYRLQFNKDVVIDLVCYRRHGHNEADEPAMTQPVMYSAIRSKKTTQELYAAKLVNEGLLSENQAAEKINEYKDKLAAGKPAVETLSYSSVPPHLIVNWQTYIGREWTDKADTRFDLKTMQSMVKRFHDVPDHMVIHRQIRKILDQRNEMAEGKRPVDWGMGETLAYATLVSEGYDIRISGQDSGRGTFSHRHAVLHNQEKRQAWVPLKHVADNQGRFTVIDSVLSEEAVLAFEYGFATTSPNTLNIWEAQFGDFVNGAQVVIDQFISSGEQKWGRLCGLVMFLPHGYEGMGAEHSSARLERFMQLCAEDNMQVCVPSTPAQTFHMLRRQMLRPYRRPLIVMTPKSLLRNPAAVSTMEELAEGNFKTIIDDARFSQSKQDVERAVMCSGKVYYDLLAKSEEENVKNIPLIRLEQLYPHPEKLMKKILESYPNLKELVWCQEEPRNQGAWDSAKHRFRKFEDQYEVTCVSRPSAAAPAVGSHKVHVQQQNELVQQALKLETK
ncbi:2-oxoglutarate dehydrogenase E1 component [uncultured Cocleimonas sp.]|uniref:2-oxoglutarate dehydrogenase E1 component n=1 Tax=uncultured Cocleimonas sp. TaxID=1051587 RepID=UPI002618DF37|nr:2-oxoglutarate dehydrogenase E1 component [uncultured Cocleimonas sp.]